LNDGAPISIPSGIFTMPGPFKIEIISTSLNDIGTYKINLKV